MQTITSCYCGTNKPFSNCCQPFLTYNARPKTAEQLMRSRYSAFVTENEDYLLFTWHKSQRPPNIEFDKKAKWLGLKIKKRKAGSASDTQGWVEFVARYKIAGKAERIEELSYFIKEDQQWFYVSAEQTL